VQDDIAQCVVKELRETLLGEAPGSDASRLAMAEVAIAAKGHGQNPEAHRLYLQGKYLVDRITQEETVVGMRYLEEALALDPSHAMAWTELSRAHANCGGYGWEPVVEGYRKAREAAKRALELAPDLAEAHLALSAIQRRHDWDWKGAEASARRALGLAPGSAEVLRSNAGLCYFLGRFEEAESLFLHATEQNPLDSGGYSQMGLLYRSMGRLADAEQAYRKAIELSPQRIAGHHVLAIILADLGRDAEALSEAKLEPAEWARLTALTYVHFLGRRQLESDQALEQLEARHGYDSAYQIAAMHAARGNTDGALTWLERAVSEKDAGAAQLRVEPVFRPLHGSPRWNQLLKTMGFEVGLEG